MSSNATIPSGDPFAWLPPTPGEIQVLLPQYEITALIGRGGMGAVYRGRQEALDRAVAIKILPQGIDDIDPTFGERFRNEALAMAKLNHPGLVAVYDFGKTPNGMLYIVMEFVDGTDVAHMMARQGRLPSDHAMAITAHVCDALKYAHERGIVHRDIKPANIMVGYDGAVKVADFGLARMDQSGQSGLTQSGMAMGTMHYIAPEALTLGASVDQRADIYAMGVMLYQMLTGQLPQGMFELPSFQVKGLDPRYDVIIGRALRSDRELRYQNVTELRRDLDAILTRPVTRVDANAAKAPAALNTTARPQRPAGGEPQRGAQRQALPPPAPPKRRPVNLGFWVPVIGTLAALVAVFVLLAHPERKTIQRIEGEDLVIVELTGGKAGAQRTEAFRSAVWSGNSHMWWHDAKLGDTLTLQLPVAETGRQRVKAVLTGAVDYAVVAVSLDGRPVRGSPFDMEAGTILVSDILDWGVFDLTAGEHRIEIKLVGNHGRSWSGGVPFCFGLDYVQMEPPAVKTVPAVTGDDVASGARPSASDCPYADHVSVKSMISGDARAMMRSDDQSQPRLAWLPRRGGMEWAQYEWERPQALNECQVFWYDDHEVGGGCALPTFWRVLYREESGAWVPVEAAIPQAERDKWSIVKFPAVKTTALRLAVQCQNGWSAGICHWKAIAADPASVADPKAKAHPDLFLGDLSPLHAQVSWRPYRVSTLYDGDLHEQGRLDVDGKPCTQFLWAHADSRIEFAIPSGYTRFTAYGIRPLNSQDNLAGDSSWKYKVEVDGKVLLESEELRTYADLQLRVDVSFPAGARRITISTDSNGDGRSDHAYWGYPMLSAGHGAVTVMGTPEIKEVVPAPPAGAEATVSVKPAAVATPVAKAAGASNPSAILPFGGHRYQFIPAQVTWEHANEIASDLGGHLATLTSIEENVWASATFKRYITATYSSILLGASRRGKNAKWHWVTGEPFEYTRWHPGEPNGTWHEAFLHLWRANANSELIDWDDGWERLDRATVGILVEWEDDGTKPLPARLNIQRFTDRVHAALENVFAAKNEETDDTLRSSLVLMRDDLVTEGRAQPAASLDAYRAAHTLCIALLSALDEREAAGSEAAWATRTETLRPGLEEQHTQVRTLLQAVHR